MPAGINEKTFLSVGHNILSSFSRAARGLLAKAKAQRPASPEEPHQQTPEWASGCCLAEGIRHSVLQNGGNKEPAGWVAGHLSCAPKKMF